MLYRFQNIILIGLLLFIKSAVGQDFDVKTAYLKRPVYIRNITIAGNNKTKDQILRSFRNSYKIVYNRSKIDLLVDGLMYQFSLSILPS